MFATSRLQLVPFDSSKHRPHFDAVLSSYAVSQYLTAVEIVPRSSKFADKLIESTIENNIIFAVFELKETGDVVGWVNSRIDNAKNRNGIFGIVVKEEHWGKGFAKEVIEWLLDYTFQNLGYHRLGLSVFAGNVRAVELYRRLGFKEEGRIREVLYKDGKWEDSIEMGILKKEWKTMKQAQNQYRCIEISGFGNYRMILQTTNVMRNSFRSLLKPHF
ncbi:acyl-CoA N-acyltransferase [Flagelloscypha sp. PMI_526]|nr:acyl-CoA N-acyltransferase [Flagelloscypha sp. PMI_526]